MADKVQVNDEKIKLLLTTVEAVRATLGTKPKGKWTTNALFKYPNGNSFNLNTIKDPQQLVHALSFLLENENLRATAAERLDVETEPFVWDGYKISEWEEDFKLRIAIVNWDVRKKQLTAAEKKLNSLISEGTRTEMELDDIAALLT